MLPMNIINKEITKFKRIGSMNSPWIQGAYETYC